MIFDILNDLAFTILGAILGFFVSLYFFIKSKNIIRIDYNIESKSSSSVNGDLHNSKITIKNTGNTIIEQINFSRFKPLTITTSKYFPNPLDEINTISSTKENIITPQYKYNSYNQCNKIILYIDLIEINEILICDLHHYGKLSLEAKLKGGTVHQKSNISSNASIKIIFIILFQSLSIILFLMSVGIISYYLTGTILSKYF